MEYYLKFVRKQVLTCLFPVRIDQTFYGPKIGKVRDAMEQGTPQAIGTVNQQESPYWTLQTMLSCGTQSERMQIRLFPGGRFHWKLGRLQVYVRRSIVHFRKPNICANFVVMQETSSCFAWLHRSRNHIGRQQSSNGYPVRSLWDTVIDVSEPLARGDPQLCPKQRHLCRLPQRHFLLRQERRDALGSAHSSATQRDVTRVVRDRAESIDGQSHCQDAKHVQR